jgi:hypothetical protein
MRNKWTMALATAACVAALHGAAQANAPSTYFKSKAHIYEDAARNWHVDIFPTNTQKYLYQIQVAGSNAIPPFTGGLACDRISAGPYGNKQFGGVYNRWTGKVKSQTHLRVVVWDGTLRVVAPGTPELPLYTTPWYPKEDILKWNWPKDCSWVKQVAK